ncbi:ABC transporter ATP-binding protein [Candidatus Bipolaricaulota bacterium]|nr:ABC transporter ATP-binding protein [Candidatus Bipolaricaulota bacterium]
MNLYVEELKKHFGGVRALDGVNVTVSQGELAGLIGPNGAGKTTFVNVITGLFAPTGGTIKLGDIDITGIPSHKIAAQGLGRTFQITRGFEQLSVLENLLVPALAAKSTSRKEVEKKAAEIMDFLLIDHLEEELSVNLSGGQQKLLELGRVLMLDPDIIVLDEPFAGVHPELRGDLHDHIDELYGAGKTFLIISHDMESIFKLCERVIVFNQGKKLIEGPPDSVREDEAVLEAYLGD